jgi:PKD domain-containing protein
MKRWLFAALLVTGSCRQTTEPPVSLVVTLESSRSTAARGDTITFTVNATGNNLVGVVIDFGDQTGDLYATGGALTARVNFKHVFQATGSFTVNAVVTDAIAGEKEAATTVVIN